MVRNTHIRDLLGKAEFFEDLVSDLRMSALHLVVYGFADVVEKSALFTDSDVCLELLGKEGREIADLCGVEECVLTE